MINDFIQFTKGLNFILFIIGKEKFPIRNKHDNYVLKVRTDFRKKTCLLNSERNAVC